MKKNTPKDLLGPVGGCSGTDAQHSESTVEISRVRRGSVWLSSTLHLLKGVTILTFASEKVAYIIISFNLNVNFLCSSLMLTPAPNKNKCFTYKCSCVEMSNVLESSSHPQNYGIFDHFVSTFIAIFLSFPVL